MNGSVESAQRPKSSLPLLTVSTMYTGRWCRFWRTHRSTRWSGTKLQRRLLSIRVIVVDVVAVAVLVLVAVVIVLFIVASDK
eukprot:scaffold84014_cov20-Prasinocladus_malaysianus.AAC.1